MENGKAGIFDATLCKVHIKPIYKSIVGNSFIYYEKKFPFFAELDNNMYVLLDFYGNRLNNSFYNGYNKNFYRNLSVIMNVDSFGHNKYGIVSSDGSTFLEPIFDSISWEENNVLGTAIKDGKTYYFCSDSNRLFDSAKIFFEHEVRDGSAYKKTQYLLIDSSTGKEFLYEYLR